jgi:hypothetical protein
MRQQSTRNGAAALDQIALSHVAASIQGVFYYF